MREFLTFDDVLIAPSYSDIDSRSEISLHQNFLGLDLELPIISANMDYVTGGKMANEMRQNGALGILHRFYADYDEQISDILKYHIPITKTPLIISLGTRNHEESLALLDKIRRNRTPHAICIDVAHGEHSKVISLIPKIKDMFSDYAYHGYVPYIIAGNVATYDGFLRLAQAGADAVKIGIGPGSVCTTREVTGVGVPQLSAIMDIVEKRGSLYDGMRYPDVKLIADGGIKNSGDIVKALAAGADVVMLGSLLAGSPECPGEVRVAPDNSRWRPYRGQSIFGTNGLKFVPEGISGWVREKPPVAETLAKLAGGIRSGMSYVGARNLGELRENVEFIKISQSTHIESSTRISQDLT